MRKEITTLVRMKLVADPAVDLDEIKHAVEAQLRDSTRWSLSNDLDAIELLAIDAPDETQLICHRLDLKDILSQQRQIAIVWEIDDVLVLRPDLTNEQAWEVLQYAQQTHDAEIGLNWFVLGAASAALFGPSTSIMENCK